MVFTGDRMSAEEALTLGLLYNVVPLLEFEKETKNLARKLAEKPPLALTSAKMAIHRGIATSLEEGLRFEQDHFCACFDTEDQKEGMAAFLEKRKPKFKGR